MTEQPTIPVDNLGRPILDHAQIGRVQQEQSVRGSLRDMANAGERAATQTAPCPSREDVGRMIDVALRSGGPGAVAQALAAARDTQ